mmetsp:Transcript_14973/g.32456  ORF Transcript_14973/g.32456 Transcript_14973/m.32456 type:complete len:124 (-) Transcript_14973:611-982(-)|eukprot:CAMPEP_0202903808 /NCGR_PEP_ID=MMETSP1392-20130828/26487_1 /ASSEMBLY_ACC=CAM_ASM_000868 /TAXON_ID=225041 /ORGANISM="Chlamydomonas chlamydogama, Strain SAG 11-48b" /LENGTH=123 /DNA_ID=CAMNT_0049591149 /DNA_START=205 /DNA_END=576 /DNA_ORIENTATION=-
MVPKYIPYMAVSMSTLGVILQVTVAQPAQQRQEVKLLLLEAQLLDTQHKLLATAAAVGPAPPSERQALAALAQQAEEAARVARTAAVQAAHPRNTALGKIMDMLDISQHVRWLSAGSSNKTSM